jgi:hypothetical protein
MGMSKPALGYQQQLDLLKNRGLIVPQDPKTNDPADRIDRSGHWF